MSDKDSEYFTVVFMGDLKALEGNPFWYRSDFGTPISIATGHALETLDDMRDVAQRPRPPAADERPLPSYGQIPWDQLGRDVMDAIYAVRRDYEFDPSYYPGHQMVPQINFNSLARIVDKYRYYGASAPLPQVTSTNRGDAA